MERIAISLFTQLDEFQKRGEEQGVRCIERKQKRPSGLSLAEIACLLMLFKLSGNKSVKTWILLSKKQLQNWFPKLGSYSNLIKWFAQMDVFMEAFFREQQVSHAGNAIYAVDSTRINAHALKTTQNPSERTAH